MLKRLGIYARLLRYILLVVGEELSYLFSKVTVSLGTRFLGPSQDRRDRTIVIVGASFAGYHVARLVAGQLPRQSRYRVVVVEPNSHFQFTWVLPRFCVVKGHEHKAFIPYGRYLSCASEDAVVEWIQDRVTHVDKTHVSLQTGDDNNGKTMIPYDYLVVATGSSGLGGGGSDLGLPSRVGDADKTAGMEKMREMQKRIEDAGTVVVVGGGAAGVEVATDAKDLYPDKRVILVHSRAAVMHRFGRRLQEEALAAMGRLGVEAILEDRVVAEKAGHVTLRSGKVLPCDYLINCAGQRPCSELLSSLSSRSIAAGGHIKVKPTLQITDERYPNIYACGDVTDMPQVPCPNARSAMRQAATVAKNLLRSIDGKKPSREYEHHWADTFIKLTLGLDRSVMFMGDGEQDLMFRARDRNVDLMAAQAWTRMGYTGFVDDDDDDDNEGPPGPSNLTKRHAVKGSAAAC